LFLSFIVAPLFLNAQNFNVDELIKLRNMNKSEIDSYLKSNNSDWKYGGYEKDKHFWTLETDKQIKNLIVALYLSLEDNAKNEIEIITGDTKTNQNITNQIQKYGMKKTGSASKDTDDGKILIEQYQGTNYVINMLKVHNNNGELIIKTHLAKR